MEHIGTDEKVVEPSTVITEGVILIPHLVFDHVVNVSDWAFTAPPANIRLSPACDIAL